MRHPNTYIRRYKESDRKFLHFASRLKDKNNKGSKTLQDFFRFARKLVNRKNITMKFLVIFSSHFPASPEHSSRISRDIAFFG